MPTRREIILDELDRWLADGTLTPEEHARLRARYASDAEAARLDAPLGAGAATVGAVPRDARGSFAVNAMQFVGGLLLGAALVALAFFLKLDGAALPWGLFLFGVAGVGGGIALQFLAPDRDGLVEALLAAGLVPVALSGLAPDSPTLVGTLAMALAVITFVLRRGRGPSVVVAGAAFVVASFGAAGPEFLGESTRTAYIWWALLIGFGCLMLVWREEAWTSAGFALYVGPLVAAFLFVADQEWQVAEGAPLELLVGGYLALLLLGGILLGIRGLVAGSATGLTVDAVVFAADLGGPGTAVVVLVVLGGLLVWQAELVRAYFGRGAR